MWSIDGSQWDIPCRVERTSEMASSEISGMLLDKSYFNDVIGTYMKYQVAIAVPFGMEEDYAALYDVLTEPVDGHEFILPYSGGVLTITGRIASIGDTYVRLPGNKAHWRKTTFEIIANHPSREMTLDEVLTRGVAPLPDASDIDVGSTYTYTSEGWETLPSGDDNYY